MENDAMIVLELGRKLLNNFYFYLTQTKHFDVDINISVFLFFTNLFIISEVLQLISREKIMCLPTTFLISTSKCGDKNSNT